MNCPKCGGYNPDGSKFCADCGEVLPFTPKEKKKGASLPIRIAQTLVALFLGFMALGALVQGGRGIVAALVMVLGALLISPLANRVFPLKAVVQIVGVFVLFVVGIALFPTSESSEKIKTDSSSAAETTTMTTEATPTEAVVETTAKTTTTTAATTTAETTTTTEETSTTTETTTTAEEHRYYVLNTNTGKIHVPSCYTLEDNGEGYEDIMDITQEWVEENGYSICGKCNPYVPRVGE